MADEQHNMQNNELARQLVSIVFEHILPWGAIGGDTGQSSRLKLRRNFEKIRTWIDSAYEIFLSRTYDDEANGHITFKRGLKAYNDEERLLPAIDSVGDAVFRQNLSSPDFISNFVGGTGWAIQKKAYENAAGEIEYKYILECDGANIRNTLRVYEFIISQLLGENDNRIFTAMAEVHHYDPETGKVWLSTNCGKLYMPFRANDCIMVQQYQPGNDVVSGGDGYITKQYELLITEVGSGGMTDENGDRLDWVKFRNFSTMMENGTPETLIKKLDTFCRLDNLTDTDRKGIIQMISVGTNAPYMDIIYGLKTDPENALKGRIGNLQGIHHHLFGWLQDFGEYLINAYIVGDVRLRRTGESLDTTVEIVKGLLATKIAETVFEVTDDANYLRNAGFTELDSNGNLRDWTVGNDDISFYSVGGEAVVSSVGTLADVRRGVKTEMIDGSQVLHIINSGISQSYEVMTQPGSHKEYDEGTTQQQTSTYQTVRNTLYLSLRIRVIKEGILTIGFPESTDTDNNAINTKTRVLERSSEWLTLQWEGTWDGQNDFFLGFTGECYISSLSLTDEPLDEFKTEYSTQIRQTSRNITLVATKTSANETSIAQLEVTASQISSTVQQNYTTLNGKITTNVTNIANLSIRAEEIAATVSSNYDSLDGRVTANASAITQTATAIRQEVSESVGGLNTRVGSLEVTSGSISGRVSAIEGDYVKSAEISMMVKKDANGYLESGVYVQADRINFEFTKNTSFYAKNGNSRVEVMNINTAGDLWIKGEYKGGKITGSVEVGSGTKKLYIEPTATGARLVGTDGGSEVLSLGFYAYNGVYEASLRLGRSYLKEKYGQFYASYSNALSTFEYELLSSSALIRLYNSTNNSNVAILRMGITNGKALIQATNYAGDSQMWPREGVDDISSLQPGTVYLRSDACLGVKQ